MNLRKSVFATILTCMIGLSSVFAGTGNYHLGLTPTRTVENEVKNVVKNLKVNFETYEDVTINLKFMVNEDSEIIVLGTNDSPIDRTLKSALNYREVDSKGLKPYKVYILPIKIKGV